MATRYCTLLFLQQQIRSVKVCVKQLPIRSPGLGLKLTRLHLDLYSSYSQFIPKLYNTRRTNERTNDCCCCCCFLSRGDAIRSACCSSAHIRTASSIRCSFFFEPPQRLIVAQQQVYLRQEAYNYLQSTQFLAILKLKTFNRAPNNTTPTQIGNNNVPRNGGRRTRAFSGQ